jgi:hypothetical protein
MVVQRKLRKWVIAAGIVAGLGLGAWIAHPSFSVDGRMYVTSSCRGDNDWSVTVMGWVRLPSSGEDWHLVAISACP